MSHVAEVLPEGVSPKLLPKRAHIAELLPKRTQVAELLPKRMSLKLLPKRMSLKLLPRRTLSLSCCRSARMSLSC